MTAALIIIAGLLLVLVVTIALFYWRGRRDGRLEAEAEHNQRAAENAEAMGKVLSESRDPDGSGDSDRMRDGTF